MDAPVTGSLIALIESAETNIHNAASGSMSDIESWLDCARDDLNKAKAAIAAMGVTGVQSEASPNRVENASQDQFNSDAPANGRFVNQGDEFARVTMEALDQNITQSEISDNENIVTAKIRDALVSYPMDLRGETLAMAFSVYKVIVPYLRTTEPSPYHIQRNEAGVEELILHAIDRTDVDEHWVRKPEMVSLAQCARVIKGTCQFPLTTAQSVLDSAGVDYVD